MTDPAKFTPIDYAIGRASDAMVNIDQGAFCDALTDLAAALLAEARKGQPAVITSDGNFTYCGMCHEVVGSEGVMHHRSGACVECQQPRWVCGDECYDKAVPAAPSPVPVPVPARTPMPKIVPDTDPASTARIEAAHAEPAPLCDEAREWLRASEERVKLIAYFQRLYGEQLELKLAAIAERDAAVRERDELQRERLDIRSLFVNSAGDLTTKVRDLLKQHDEHVIGKARTDMWMQCEADLRADLKSANDMLAKANGQVNDLLAKLAAAEAEKHEHAAKCLRELGGYARALWPTRVISMIEREEAAAKAARGQA